MWKQKKGVPTSWSDVERRKLSKCVFPRIGRRTILDDDDEGHGNPTMNLSLSIKGGPRVLRDHTGMGGAFATL